MATHAVQDGRERVHPDVKDRDPTRSRQRHRLFYGGPVRDVPVPENQRLFFVGQSARELGEQLRTLNRAIQIHEEARRSSGEQRRAEQACEGRGHGVRAEIVAAERPASRSLTAAFTIGRGSICHGLMPSWMTIG